MTIVGFFELGQSYSRLKTANLVFLRQEHLSTISREMFNMNQENFIRACNRFRSCIEAIEAEGLLNKIVEKSFILKRIFLIKLFIICYIYFSYKH